MASQMNIVNQALIELGDITIVSLDEDTKAGRVMKALWTPTLKDVLRDHTWRFARKRVALNQLASSPAYQWTYAYQLPSDYIRMVYMGEPEDQYQWDIEGQTLLTDETEAYVTYVRFVEDTGLFDPKFVTALSLQLAIRAYKSLAGSTAAEKAELLKSYEKVLLDAETIDSQEAPAPKQDAYTWANSRL